MKVLVTGGAGFIGSNLVDGLIEAGHEVAVMDNLSTGKKENVNTKASFFESDVTDKEAVKKIFEEFKPEAVHHLAAQASVRISTENPQEDVRINVIGIINLLSQAIESGVKKFIFSSTGGAIYGDGVERPTVETATEDPVCPYGIDKLFGEKYVHYFTNLSKLQTICLRYANVYGPRQNPKGEAGVVAIFAGKLLNGEPIDVNGTGDQTRDYVFVSDVVAANLAALNSDKTSTYNVGTGVETSVNQIAEMMKKITASQSTVNHVPAKPGEQMYSSLSTEKLETELGWSKKVTIEEGLALTINYFKDAPS
jgi:UDP-glucose 4-epimerase